MLSDDQYSKESSWEESEGVKEEKEGEGVGEMIKKKRKGYDLPEEHQITPFSATIERSAAHIVMELAKNLPITSRGRKKATKGDTVEK